MRERLLATIREGTLLPSFFELHILRQMTSLVSTACRHTLQTFFHHIDPTATLNDDVLALAGLYLQWSCLRLSDATVIERLYGLIRVQPASSSADAESKPITDRQRQLSLLATILPLVLSRLSSLNDANSNNSNRTGSHRNSVVTRILKALPHLYEGCCLLQQVLYLLDASPHFDPIHSLLGIVLVRRKRHPNSDSSSGNQRSVRFLIFLALAVKLAQWLLRYNASAPTSSIAAPRIPPAPSPPSAATGGVPLPDDPELCPLCRKPRSRACVSTGGFVFCHSCLTKALTRTPRCPVTGAPCSPDDIILIYENSMIE